MCHKEVTRLEAKKGLKKEEKKKRKRKKCGVAG